jgi:hypothetical protein
MSGGSLRDARAPDEATLSKTMNRISSKNRVMILESFYERNSHGRGIVLGCKRIHRNRVRTPRRMR